MVAERIIDRLYSGGPVIPADRNYFWCGIPIIEERDKLPPKLKQAITRTVESKPNPDGSLPLVVPEPFNIHTPRLIHTWHDKKETGSGHGRVWYYIEFDHVPIARACLIEAEGVAEVNVLRVNGLSPETGTILLMRRLRDITREFGVRF